MERNTALVCWCFGFFFPEGQNPLTGKQTCAILAEIWSGIVPRVETVLLIHVSLCPTRKEMVSSVWQYAAVRRLPWVLRPVKILL